MSAADDTAVPTGAYSPQVQSGMEQGTIVSIPPVTPPRDPRVRTSAV